MYSIEDDGIWVGGALEHNVKASMSTMMNL